MKTYAVDTSDGGYELHGDEIEAHEDGTLSILEDECLVAVFASGQWKRVIQRRTKPTE
jgi:hypothetical protein